MKIINCFLGKSRGGIEVVALDYADALAECGYESEILTLKKRNYTDYLIKGGHKMHYLIGRGLNPITILHFIKIIKSAKPDIVFLHGTKAVEFGTNRFVKLLCPNIKFIGVSHGVINKKYKKLKYALGIANFLKQELKNIGIQNTYSCQNTIRTNQTIPLLSPHSEENHIPVIGALARDSRIKGWDILFEALGILKQKQIPFKCMVSVKKDNYEEQINRLGLDENCEFLGWVSDKEEFFKKTDLYCLPSRGEGLPLTVLEAMMYEKPIAVSDCPGSVEIVKDSKAGFIHHIGNTKQLAEQLEFLLTHPEERQTMGKNARQHILSHFNNKDLPNRLKKIIEDVYTK